VAGWSTQQLVEFLAAISLCTDETSAMLTAVERAAEALDAEISALVTADRCLSATGFAAGEIPVDELTAIVRGEATTVWVAGIGACETRVAALDESEPARLIVARAPGEPFDHEDTSVLRGMARVLILTLRQLRLIESERILRERSQREVSERRAAELALAHQVLHDALTGLPNRTLLLDRLEHGLASARREGTVVAVLFIDIDNFKLINDTLGHHVGDELLKLVAGRLHDSLRSRKVNGRAASDTVARFGGDEFVVLSEGLRDASEAAGIATRIAARFSEPFKLEGEQLAITASTGIAVGDAHSTPQSLIRDADAAMYHAKGRGRARFELFDDAMRGRLVERVGREKELRRALEGDEMVLFYQPIFDVRSGVVRGAETLIRWRHPERGLLTAGDFVPLAEESGLIVQLDDWVIDAACHQLAEWQRSGVHGKDVTLSLNVSARQLEDGRFAERLEAVLRESGAAARGLGVELTETVLIENSEAPVRVLEALRSLGPRLILDDFGTGYSSLSYLQRLPLDALKLDRAFVAGIATSGRDRDIVSALVNLARVLDLQVIVEGVETEAQLQRLKELGCLMAQGYHLGRPMPAADYEALLRASRAGRTALPAGSHAAPAKRAATAA
jgi:diguanylate cyclase (GGDEF)-like protein